MIALGVWLFQWWTYGRFIESTNDAYFQADSVTIATRVSGFVDRVFVADNEAVTAGQQLVKIDERDPRARRAQARAQASQAQASIAQAEAQIEVQEAQITEAQARSTAARSQASYAGRQARRYAALATSGAQTNEQYDQMRQNLDQADAQVAETAAAVLAAQHQIDAYKAQIQQASAQVAQAQAQEQQAQVDLDATLVRASLDGRIGDKTVRVGQFVQPGTRMMTVVPVEHMYVIANFKETQMDAIRVGQPATIEVDALSGRVLHGTVESFSPGTGSQFALIPPDNATGNFTKVVQRVPVRIHVDVPSDVRAVLVPGLSVTASVDTKSPQAGLPHKTSAGEIATP